MIEVIAGVAGGLGLFFVGMWLLTDNLRTLASRRLRMIAHRWTENGLSGFSWGALAGTVTQNSTALTFILVSMLRSGLISTRGALIVLIGGNIGVTLLVLVVTFDIELISMGVLGIAGVAMISERLSRYRPVAASFFGGAMIVLGLVLLKQAVAPLADEPWFSGMVESVEGSLVLAFLIGAILTVIVQSVIVVCVVAVSVATLGVITIDQTIMLIYGCVLGASVALLVLSAGLTGRARQVAIYQVLVNGLSSPVLVAVFCIEIYLDVPLLKALAFSFDMSLAQQLALCVVLIPLFCSPFMILTLNPSVRLLERLWPPTTEEETSRTKFIHDHALSDVESALALIDLEQRRVFEILTQYFEKVRQGERVDGLHEATRHLLSEIEEFLVESVGHHPMQSVEDHSSMLTRQKLLSWLEDQVADLCGMLQALPDRPDDRALRTSICEGVDAVFLSLLHAIESGDDELWPIVRTLTGDRSSLMSGMRNTYWKREQSLDESERVRIVEITNTVEHIFFLLSKLVRELDTSPIPSTYDLVSQHMGSADSRYAALNR